jgi:hypothetical protein
MSIDLQTLLKAFKNTFNVDDKMMQIIEKQVNYLNYSFYDVLESYKDEKIAMDSLIIFFGYLFGNLIEDDKTLETLITVIKGVYLAKKIKKLMS